MKPTLIIGTAEIKKIIVISVLFSLRTLHLKIHEQVPACSLADIA